MGVLEAVHRAIGSPWSEQHKAVQQMMRRFIEAEVKPNLEALEHGGLPPYDILRKMMRTFGIDELNRARFSSQIEREREAAARGEPPPERAPSGDRGEALALQMIPDDRALPLLPGAWSRRWA